VRLFLWRKFPNLLYRRFPTGSITSNTRRKHRPNSPPESRSAGMRVARVLTPGSSRTVGQVASPRLNLWRKHARPPQKLGTRHSRRHRSIKGPCRAMKTRKTFGHFNVSKRNPAPFPRFSTCYTLLHLVTPKFFSFFCLPRQIAMLAHSAPRHHAPNIGCHAFATRANGRAHNSLCNACIVPKSESK